MFAQSKWQWQAFIIGISLLVLMGVLALMLEEGRQSRLAARDALNGTYRTIVGDRVTHEIERADLLMREAENAARLTPNLLTAARTTLLESAMRAEMVVLDGHGHPLGALTTRQDDSIGPIDIVPSAQLPAVGDAGAWIGTRLLWADDPDGPPRPFLGRRLPAAGGAMLVPLRFIGLAAICQQLLVPGSRVTVTDQAGRQVTGCSVGASASGLPATGASATVVAGITFRITAEIPATPFLGDWMALLPLVAAGGAAIALAAALMLVNRYRSERAQRWARAAFEAVPASIALYDRHDRLIIANQATAASFPDLAPDLLRPGASHTAMVQRMHERGAIVAVDGRPWPGESAFLAQPRTASRPSRYEMRDGRHIQAYDFAGHDYTIRVRADITELVAREQATAHVLKLEAMGQLTGGFVHDMNNRLGTMQAVVALLEDQVGSDSPLIARLRKSIGQLTAMAQRMLSFARKTPLCAEEVDICALAERLLDEIGGTMGENALRCACTSTAFVDPIHLSAALLNLIKNSHAAGSRRNQIDVTDHGGGVLVTVADTGQGMTPDVLNRADEPFFTTRQQQGTGLGLAQVQSFAQQSGGWIDINSEPERGTTVRLWLPRHASRAPQPAGGPRVLVVDDDPASLAVFSVQIGALGYQVRRAASASEALRSLDDSVELLLTDIQLGEDDGLSLAEAARRRRPALKVAYMSGGDAPPEAVPLLRKPFSLAELRAILAGLRVPKTPSGGA